MKRRWLAGALTSVLLFGGWITAALHGQGPFPAQIQAAIQALLQSNAVVSGNWTCTGVCTGFGGGGGGVTSIGGMTGVITCGTGITCAGNAISGSGSATLTATYVGYGSGANALTGDANLTWSGTVLAVTGTTTAIAPAVGSNSFSASGYQSNIDSSGYTPTLASPAAPGNVDNGAHRYVLTYGDYDGHETAADLVHPTPSVTVVDKTVNGTIEVAIPYVCNDQYPRVFVYRQDGGSGTYKLVGDSNFFCELIFEDNVANADLGVVAPSTNTTNQVRFLVSGTTLTAPNLTNIGRHWIIGDEGSIFQIFAPTVHADADAPLFSIQSAEAGVAGRSGGDLGLNGGGGFDTTALYLGPASLTLAGGDATNHKGGNAVLQAGRSGAILVLTGGGVSPLATVATLTANQINFVGTVVPRVATPADATSITPNTDSADYTYQANTQSVGTLTINADGGSPVNGQRWILKIKSTNVQTFSFSSSAKGYLGGTVALPTATTGGTKVDYFAFLFDGISGKWHYVGTAAGF